MSIKVPSIAEMVRTEMQSIKERREALSNTTDWYEYDRLTKSIQRSEGMLNKFKSEVRDEKLNQLGIDGD